MAKLEATKQNLIGEGLTSRVLTDGKRVCKVFNNDVHKDDVFREAYLMALVEQVGIASPRVLQVSSIDGNWVLEMNLVRGEIMLTPLMEALESDDYQEVCRLIRQLASLQVRINRTKAHGFPKYKDFAINLIRNNPALDSEQRVKQVEYINSLPAGDCVIHGDFHPINIIIEEDGSEVVIDWRDVGSGVAACDAARTYLNLSAPPLPILKGHKLHEIYIDAYTAMSGVAEKDISDWFPVHAAKSLGGRDPLFSAQMEKYLL